MVLFRLICDYFKSKNWNILFFYSLRGICEALFPQMVVDKFQMT